MVLPDGRVVETGFRGVLDNASGYSLTHLFCGAEGTLGVVTRATIKLQPREGDVVPTAYSFKKLKPAAKAMLALACHKLYTVHLNDQNGPKFDQDKSFGSVDLRRAFNQVRILDHHDYGANGEFVGLDVKAMRTQKQEVATKHLANSRTVFLRLLELSRGLDPGQVEQLIARRDYEELEMTILTHLLGG